MAQHVKNRSKIFEGAGGAEPVFEAMSLKKWPEKSLVDKAPPEAFSAGGITSTFTTSSPKTGGGYQWPDLATKSGGSPEKRVSAVMLKVRFSLPGDIRGGGVHGVACVGGSPCTLLKPFAPALPPRNCTSPSCSAQPTPSQPRRRACRCGT